MSPDQAIANIRANGHKEYPYGQVDRFLVDIDLYENADDADPCYTGTLGALFDANLEAEGGGATPGELEEHLTDFLRDGQFMYGMGFWVVRRGERPAHAPSAAI